MKLKNCDVKTFFERVQDDSLICYGVGYEFFYMLENTEEYHWDKKITALIDNNLSRNGTEEMIQGKNIKVYNAESILKSWNEKNVILITCSYYYEIINMLNKIDFLENTECYIWNFMLNKSSGEKIPFKTEGEFFIPQTIHYCWFGGRELPDLYKYCIDSWHKYCPNYKIIEWNESNCDLNENLYSKQAYEVGKYGFVPDYFRLKIIYEHGGIYLDTDVEVIKNLDDLRREEAFCGMQVPGEIAFGLGFGAVKNNKVVGKLLSTYDKLKFINQDGSLNEVASPIYQTNDLINMGFKNKNSIQKVDGMVIYPSEVLSPKSLYTGITECTHNTYMIHHFDGSWISSEKAKKRSEKYKRAEEIKKMMEEVDK